MPRSLLTVPTVLVLLCGPAVAQPSAAAPPSGATPVAAELALSLVVTHGTQARTHAFVIHTDACGQSAVRTEDREDEIEVCARPSPRGTQLDLRWKLRDGATRYRGSSSAVVQRGSTVQIAHADAVRIQLAVR